jgi:hypothetical protein
MTTERLLKEGQAESMRQERIEVCQDVIVVGEDSFVKKTPSPASIWLPGAHAARKRLFFSPDGDFLVETARRSRSLCPSIEFHVKGK